jgi:hypothetical protein
VRKLDHRTYHEISVYRKLLDHTPEEQDGSKKRYEVIGEMKDDPVARKEKVDLGPWGDEPFLFDGMEVTTDAEGVFKDAAGVVLGRFDADDLGKTETAVVVEHAQLGEATVEISRDILLKSFGIRHMYAKKSAGLRGWTKRDGFDTQGVCPEQLARGKSFVVEVRVTNGGEAYTGEIVGRMVSRASWLNGRNFYIGILAPGQERRFSRRFQVPSDAPAGDVFAVVGLYDHILRSMPTGNGQMRLKITEQ